MGGRKTEPSYLRIENLRSGLTDGKLENTGGTKIQTELPRTCKTLSTIPMYALRESQKDMKEKGNRENM